MRSHLEKKPNYGQEYYYKKATGIRPASLRTIPLKNRHVTDKGKKPKKSSRNSRKSNAQRWKPKAVNDTATVMNQEEIPEPEIFSMVVDGEVKYYRKRYIPKE